MFNKIILTIILIVSFAVAESYLPGEIIIQFHQNYRNQISFEVNEGIVQTNVPSVDRLNQKWQIDRFNKLIKDPHPNDLAKSFSLDLLYSLYFSENTDVAAVVKDFENDPAIAFAGPNLILPVDISPNDPYFPSQWHLHKTQCPLAWDATTGNPAVSVMAIDQGVDYTHPDLAYSFKVNTPEDINSNGIFDPTPSTQGGDLNGADDDGNGYIDDVIGYDFVSSDPNPIPEGGDDHGTLCAGVEVASTNNGIGVASYGWNCKQVSVRAGSAGGIYTAQAISATYYAVARGVNVISMSYGGSSYYQPSDNAVQYAWFAGCVLTGSAGNTFSNWTPRYPACYNNVIACAASDVNDMRSNWGGGQESNYAPWVDVTAPGTGVLTTGNGTSYSAPDGTSFSAPCVAGLALMLKSMYPSMTNAECTLRIFQSCDTMPDPQYVAGNLGHGRINATKAIYQPIRCHLRTTEFRLNDGNDNYPQANENVAIITTMANESGYQNADSVSATISCSDPDITITKNNATFPMIEAGRTGNCSADSFVFHVATTFIPHRVRFIINFTASPASIRTTDTIHINVGNPRILLVDDDNGVDYERWYKQAIDSLKTFYRVWNTISLGSPSLDTLLAYPVVIWFTGLDSLNTLTTDDQNNLTSYLNQGKNLFICGQNIGQNIGTTPFYSNYLHASYVTTHTAQLYAVGVPGDPIGGVNGDTIVLGGAGGAANATSCDGIRPLGGAYGSFWYRNYADTTVYGAVRFSNTYKVVYFSMPFEAINHTAPRYTQKWEIMRRILTFFNEPLPQGIEDHKITTPSTINRPFINIFPNPFSKQTCINFNLPVMRSAQVNIYNAAGELVKSIATTSSSLQWDGTDRAGNKLMNGVYFCELKTEHGSSVKKAVILR
jgi:subtilisin family serine protease